MRILLYFTCFFHFLFLFLFFFFPLKRHSRMGFLSFLLMGCMV